MKQELESKVLLNNIEMPLFYKIHTKKNDKITHTHYHSYIEILYILDGGSHVYVDGTTYTLASGDMIIINSNIPHETCAVNKETKELFVKFEVDTLNLSNNYIYNFHYAHALLSRIKNEDCIIRKNDLCNTHVPSSLINGVNECIHKDYGFEYAMKAELLQIFLWIVRYWKKKGIIPDISELYISKLAPALKYAQDQYADANCNTASKLCNMSYSYFSKTFKKTLSQNFSEYVNCIRISESKHLLQSTNKTVTEIAMITGFSSTGHFISSFKKHTKLTPHTFRKRTISSDWFDEFHDSVSAK